MAIRCRNEWQLASHGFAVSVILAAPMVAAAQSDTPRKLVSPTDQISALVAALNTDVARNPDESTADWLKRQCLHLLETADKTLKHPQAESEHIGLARERKLTALAVLGRREPDQFARSLQEYVDELNQVVPRSPLAGTATARLLDLKIRQQNKPMMELLDEVSMLAANYPNGPQEASRIYVAFARRARLEDGHLKRANVILNHGVATLKNDDAKRLAQWRNRFNLPGQPWPHQWVTIDGETWDYSKSRGKVVLLFTWSTSCVPCIAKFPLLTQLNDQFSEQGFELVTISQDERASDVVEFMKNRELPLGIHVMESREFADEFGHSPLSDIVILNRRGEVAHIDEGDPSRESLVKKITRLLGPSE